MSEPSKDEARRQVEARRAAFEGTFEAVAARVESRSQQVEAAMVRARDVTGGARALVTKHPLVFVAASVGVGLALGMASRGRRARLSARVEAPQAPRAERPSLLWSAAGFLGKMVLRGLVGSLGGGREPPSGPSGGGR